MTTTQRPSAFLPYAAFFLGALELFTSSAGSGGLLSHAFASVAQQIGKPEFLVENIAPLAQFFAALAVAFSVRSRSMRKIAAAVLQRVPIYGLRGPWRTLRYALSIGGSALVFYPLAQLMYFFQPDRLDWMAKFVFVGDSGFSWPLFYALELLGIVGLVFAKSATALVDAAGNALFPTLTFLRHGIGVGTDVQGGVDFIAAPKSVTREWARENQKPPADVRIETAPFGLFRLQMGQQLRILNFGAHVQREPLFARTISNKCLSAEAVARLRVATREEMPTVALHAIDMQKLTRGGTNPDQYVELFERNAFVQEATRLGHQLLQDTLTIPIDSILQRLGPGSGQTWVDSLSLVPIMVASAEAQAEAAILRISGRVMKSTLPLQGTGGLLRVEIILNEPHVSQNYLQWLRSVRTIVEDMATGASRGRQAWRDDVLSERFESSLESSENRKQLAVLANLLRPLAKGIHGQTRLDPRVAEGIAKTFERVVAAMDRAVNNQNAAAGSANRQSAGFREEAGRPAA